MNNGKATYTNFLRIATQELECGLYKAAEVSLARCVRLATSFVTQQPPSDTNLEAYCKAVILLAATKLRMHQQAAALNDFSQSLHTLNRLYTSNTESDVRALIQRYQCVLIRANQSACALSRLHSSMGGYTDGKQTPSPLYH
ncbi:hypothetical protein CWE12_07275 [Aliidiomarina sedimenti]|uniref:Uncharacterized protein n=2 Tax=Aliidiomarina sedimenti TaxID=1933879 RepID=A0ABY0BYL0_9GAMM|nr:hypothetical protein CWE12_07275 [Aliidiomarina sedimenti]